MSTEIQVEGSRAEIKPHQSIPHISVLNLARALRWHPDATSERLGFPERL